MDDADWIKRVRNDPIIVAALKAHYETRYLKSKDPSHFWARVDKQTSDGCWEWTGAKSAGYGRVGWQGKVVLAHRVAYELGHGKAPPEDLLVCHRCDNPPCCNPSHLFLGSHADNTKDMIAKGRHHKQKNGARTCKQ